MVVGTGIVDLFVGGSRSLKEKRAVLRRILGRTKNAFNVSIAEVGAYNSWKRCRIGFSMVGNEKGFVNSKMDKIVNFIEGLQLADVIGVSREISTVSDAWGSDGDDGIDGLPQS
ncbi:MAG: DUF503 domain-containing protein [Deltaproteobacteria bacterium]|nr:DUF503 domain-containing protein [Deltaproteobacteria bacterium]